MLKDNQHQFVRGRVIFDLLSCVLVYFFTYFLFFHVFPKGSFLSGSFSGAVTAIDYKVAIVYIAPLNLVLYGLCRLYRPMRVTGRRREAFDIFRANFTCILLLVVVFWLFVKPYSIHFSRIFLIEFGVLNTIFMVFQRNMLRITVVSVRKQGHNQKHILVVGYSRGAEQLLDRVHFNPQWGYNIFGILDDGGKIKKYREYSVIGTLQKLPEILEQNNIDEVFVTLALAEYAKLRTVVAQCEKAGVQTKFVPDYGNLMSNRPYTEDLLGLPVIYMRNVPLSDTLNAFMKRSFDILGSLLAILLFSPFMLIIAICIKISSPGPIIFKQERIGRHNKPFMMYKFRSMRMQTEKDEKKGWTTKDDPRVTGIGKIIRKTSLDETPQFFNVLTGKMSMVGPRPERPQFVEKFKEEIPRYMIKHLVRPGITGWAQINGYRGDTSIEKRVEHDIYYIENWSLGLDLKIIFLTFFKGFINKNAY